MLYLVSLVSAELGIDVCKLYDPGSKEMKLEALEKYDFTQDQEYVFMYAYFFSTGHTSYKKHNIRRISSVAEITSDYAKYIVYSIYLAPLFDRNMVVFSLKGMINNGKQS